MIIRVLKWTRLNRVAHHLYYCYFHGFNAGTRSTLVGLDQAFARAHELGTLANGDYYEFGLFKGYSFYWAQKNAGQYKADALRFFGFDSFEGLPEVTEGPDAEQDDFYEGQYACSYETVRAALAKKGIDWKRTVLVKGFYDESLTDALREEHKMRSVVIALIDCDLYRSTADVLKFLDPLIVDRSILIFDDWNCNRRDDAKGERKAFGEFLGQRPDIEAEPLFEYGAWGQAFLVHIHGAGD
jgi:hypothetical protein